MRNFYSLFLVALSFSECLVINAQTSVGTNPNYDNFVGYEIVYNAFTNQSYIHYHENIFVLTKDSKGNATHLFGLGPKLKACCATNWKWTSRNIQVGSPLRLRVEGINLWKYKIVVTDSSKNYGGDPSQLITTITSAITSTLGQGLVGALAGGSGGGNSLITEPATCTPLRASIAKDLAILNTIQSNIADAATSFPDLLTSLTYKDTLDYDELFKNFNNSSSGIFYALNQTYKTNFPNVTDATPVFNVLSRAKNQLLTNVPSYSTLKCNQPVDMSDVNQTISSDSSLIAAFSVFVNKINTFRYSHVFIQQMPQVGWHADKVTENIIIFPRDTITSSGLHVTGGKISAPTRGGLHFQFGLGLYTCGFRNRTYSMVSDTTAASTKKYIVANNNPHSNNINDVNFGISAQAFFMYGLGQYCYFGGTLGAGFATDLNGSLMLGPAFSFGTKTQVAISGGYCVSSIRSPADYYSFAYTGSGGNSNNQTGYSQINDSKISYKIGFRCNWFFGITINIPTAQSTQTGTSAGGGSAGASGTGSSAGASKKGS